MIRPEIRPRSAVSSSPLAKVHFIAFLAAFALLFAGGSATAQLACDTPATVTDLGGGCGAPAPVLTSTLPLIGDSVTLNFESEFPLAPIFVFVTSGVPTPFVINFPNGDSCSIYYEFGNSAIILNAFTDANGDFSVTAPIANNPGLAGVRLTVQSRAWAAGGGLNGDHFSNALVLEFGCPDTSTGEIGDTVYCDLNDNGVQDPGDVGIPGVTVNLTCDSGLMASTVTDENGYYLFDDLPAGDCTVTVDPTTAPANKIPGTNCPGSYTVILAQGQSFLDADFCFTNVVATGEIGDTVFCDFNDDGIQDAGDLGIPGVTVNLSCDNGVTATAVTDQNGQYLFEDLPAGNCTVTVDMTTVPADKAPGTNCVASYNVALTEGESFLDADFCFRNTGEIGDTVFCDLDDDGVQDSNEPGIPGVVISLSCASSGISMTATTDANGQYLFDNLPGNEVCTVTVDSTTSPVDKAPGPNCPIEFSVTLAPGESFLDADFCFVTCSECDGGVTSLTLEYQGDVANALVEADDGSVIFSGIVQPGGLFTVNGQESDGRFDSNNLVLTVNGSTAAEIHVSCSQPIGVGSVFGDFLVVAGQSRDGGAMCALRTCDFGKPCGLLLQYTGDGCAATSNTQSPDKVECSGDPMMAAQVMILATDKADPDDGGALVWFSGQVSLGDTFSLNALAGGESRLKSETHIHIFDLADNLLQSVEFHTSCSQPLNIDDQFGAVRLVDFTPEGQCPIPEGADICGVLPSPKALLMTYTGEDCSATSSDQDPSKVNCSGDPMFAATVEILSTNKEDPNDSGAKVWFQGTVPLNGNFEIDATNAGEADLDSATFVHIFDAAGNLLQSIEFHTSCSQPIALGNQFGSCLLIGYTPKD